jgi:putative endonuclease
MSPWFVYMVRCADDSLYTGVATDVERRVEEHNRSDALAARYTRARRPVTPVYWEVHGTRAQATRREFQIKRLHRTQKEALIRAMREDGPQG